jgi:hypothetical protein
VADSSVAYLLDETVLTRREAAERLRCSVNAVRNYIERGVGGVGGVRLEGVVVGAQWKTSAEAVDRFVEARTAQALGLPAAGRGTARQARKADEQARRELEAAGWL